MALESALLICPALYLHHAVLLHFWVTGTCTEKLSGLVKVGGIAFKGREKKSRVLFTTSALSFIAIDSWDHVQENVHSGTEWTSPANHNEETCTAKLWRSQWQQWISTLSKMFLELKKEFKVRNILERDTNADLVGWRKCSQVSSHSSAWKDRFA